MIKIDKNVRCHPKILTTAWNEIEEFLFWGGSIGYSAWNTSPPLNLHMDSVVFHLSQIPTFGLA